MMCIFPLAFICKNSRDSSVAKRLDIIHEDNYQKGRELLIRIIMLLTKLAQKSD